MSDRLLPLEEALAAVLAGVGAVAEASDIHPRAEADVLEGGERLDARFGVVRGHR